MDEEPKKPHKLPSMLEMSEMFDKVQSQMNPLSYQLEKSNSLLGIASQYERLTSAVSIAKKAQQLSIASTSVVDHSVIARNVELRLLEAMAVQDNFLGMTKGMSDFNNSLMSVRESLIQSTGGTNVYENMMSSISLIRDSLEPYRSAFDTVRASFEASEPFKLASELQSQVALANSTSSEYLSIFEQFESLRNLDYFQSIFRRNDFQFEEVLNVNLTQEDITNFSRKPMSEIDAELSDEIKLEKDFSLYSEKAKKILYFFCTAILLSYLIGIASSITANYIQQFQEVSKTLETSREVKSFTRSSPPLIDRQALKGHRVTTANNLNFRHKPSMNSNVIELLPIGTIVKVVDKSNRSWLLVEVEIDGEIEQGWVLRRYTTYFK